MEGADFLAACSEDQLKDLAALEIPTMRHLPAGVLGALGRVLERKVLAPLLEELEKKDGSPAPFFLTFLFFPFMVLGCVEGSTRTKCQKIKARLQKFEEGKFVELLLDAASERSDGESERREPFSACERATLLARVGEFSRAASALQGDVKVAPASQATVDRFKSKLCSRLPAHPRPPRPTTFPDPPLAQPGVDEADAVFDFKSFEAALSSAPKLSAGRGWKFEHFQTLWKGKHIPSLFRITQITAARGEAVVPTTVQFMLCLAMGLGLINPDEPDAVRPLLIGGCFSRLCRRSVAFKGREEFATFLSEGGGSKQLGVGVRGGQDLLIHAIRSILDEHPESRGCQKRVPKHSSRDNPSLSSESLPSPRSRVSPLLSCCVVFLRERAGWGRVVGKRRGSEPRMPPCSIFLRARPAVNSEGRDARGVGVGGVHLPSGLAGRLRLAGPEGGGSRLL